MLLPRLAVAFTGLLLFGNSIKGVFAIQERYVASGKDAILSQSQLEDENMISEVMREAKQSSVPDAVLTDCSDKDEIAKWLLSQPYAKINLCAEVNGLQTSPCKAALKGIDASKVLGGTVLGQSAYFRVSAICQEKGTENVTCDDFVVADGCPNKLTPFTNWKVPCGESCNIAQCCVWKRDECKTKKHNCHEKAICTDTLSSFTCHCNPGYLGDGVKECHEHNECETGLHTCHAKATCNDKEGGFSCVCNAGFSGDGTHCSDENECVAQTDDCNTRPNTACHNTFGSFECKCLNGYSRNGDECVGHSCDIVQPPANGKMGTCGSLLNHASSCLPSCNEGFELSAHTSCHSGVLNASICSAKGCDVNAPANGEYFQCPQNLKHGESCEQKCSNGYVVKGSHRVKCELGNYDPVICEPEGCAKPQLVQNGLEGACNGSLAHGESCQPDCHPGFEVSETLTQCKFGKLVTTATCKEVPCNASSPPEHGTEGDCPAKLAHSATCQPECQTGYTASGKTVCKQGSLAPATCLPSPCKNIQAPLNGKMGECESTLGHDEKCTFECNAGYAPKSESSCTFGAFEAGACVELQCAVPKVLANGTHNCGDFLASGGTCNPVCNAGFDLKKSFSCHLGSLTPAVCEKIIPKELDCSGASVPPENGHPGDCETGALKSGASCTPTCDLGYSLSQATHCSNGTLTAATCEAVTCELSGPPANAKAGTCQQSLKHGEDCAPECETGYSLSRRTSCHAGSIRQGHCEAKSCDASGAPAHGTVGTCTNKLASGAVCQAECNAGYSIYGVTSCNMGVLANASCRPKGCDSHVPANGVAGTCESDKMEDGTSCQPQCNEGYVVSGATSCNKGSIVPAVCQPQKCTNEQPVPENGKAGNCGKELGHESTCTAECNVGYEVIGSTSCSFGKLVSKSSCKVKLFHVAERTESCDDTCASFGQICDTDALSASAGSQEKTEALFGKSGFKCQSHDSHCSSVDKCREWGAPYLLKGSFHRTQKLAYPCFYGNATASCDQVPTDADSRRLCACAVNPNAPAVVSTTTAAANGIFSLALEKAKHDEKKVHAVSATPAPKPTTTATTTAAATTTTATAAATTTTAASTTAAAAATTTTTTTTAAAVAAAAVSTTPSAGQSSTTFHSDPAIIVSLAGGSDPDEADVAADGIISSLGLDDASEDLAGKQVNKKVNLRSTKGSAVGKSSSDFSAAKAKTVCTAQTDYFGAESADACQDKCRQSKACKAASYERTDDGRNGGCTLCASTEWKATEPGHDWDTYSKLA
eukprot:TRINITY_DN7567_c2_g2_i3.p1 TRINITY_DN7567_c2_g2~~TRINITY_DN7567_c2_g2_i3.p1  ORF type:complete len:1278 (-),score=259.26 TRINITY_DN7567_c2_g2_i3:120-3953(-)